MSLAYESGYPYPVRSPGTLGGLLSFEIMLMLVPIGLLAANMRRWTTGKPLLAQPRTSSRFHPQYQQPWRAWMLTGLLFQVILTGVLVAAMWVNMWGDSYLTIVRSLDNRVVYTGTFGLASAQEEIYTIRGTDWRPKGTTALYCPNLSMGKTSSAERLQCVEMVMGSYVTLIFGIGAIICAVYVVIRLTPFSFNSAHPVVARGLWLAFTMQITLMSCMLLLYGVVVKQAHSITTLFGSFWMVLGSLCLSGLIVPMVTRHIQYLPTEHAARGLTERPQKDLLMIPQGAVAYDVRRGCFVGLPVLVGQPIHSHTQPHGCIDLAQVELLPIPFVGPGFVSSYQVAPAEPVSAQIVQGQPGEAHIVQIRPGTAQSNEGQPVPSPHQTTVHLCDVVPSNANFAPVTCQDGTAEGAPFLASHSGAPHAVVQVRPVPSDGGAITRMFCSYCGSRYAVSDAAFCAACGRSAL